MQLKILAVVALLGLGCSFAAAQTYGFVEVDGGLYCNYEELSVASTYGADVWQVTDNLSVCGVSVNATGVGIKAALPKAGNAAGFTVSGVAYADNIYDASSGSYTGAQWFMVTALPKCPIRKPQLDWIGFASVSGVVFGSTYGQLTCSIPGKDEAPTRGLTTGQHLR